MENQKIDDKQTIGKTKGTKILTNLTKPAKAVVNLATKKKRKSRRKILNDAKIQTPQNVTNVGKPPQSKSVDNFAKISTKLKNKIVKKLNNNSKGKIILNKKVKQISAKVIETANCDKIDNNEIDSGESEYKTIINEDSRGENDETSGTVQPDLNFTQMNDPNDMINGQERENLNSTHWEIFKIDNFATSKNHYC